MPMDPYELTWDLPGDPGDPGDQYNYQGTQEKHLEDMQSERKEEIGANWTKNKENGDNTGMNDDNDDDDNKDDDNKDDDASNHYNHL